MTPIRIHERPLVGPIDPFEAYLRLCGGAPAVLLDAAPPTFAANQRAYVLFDPFDCVRVAAGSDRSRPAVDPFAHLFASLAACGEVTDAVPGHMRGGAAGFLAYDLGRHLERIPDTARLISALPDLWFGLFNRGLEIDLASGAGTLFCAELPTPPRVGSAYVERALDEAEARLCVAASGTGATSHAAGIDGVLRANFTRGSYQTAVEAVRQHILAGDVYQVNLSQRFAGTWHGCPRELYRRLRRRNPAPFGALIETGQAHILSSSPERFLRRTGSEVETRPIKGTRKRTGDALRDAVAVADLLSAPKDAAELAMIIDLQRNDLGRVCVPGSIAVDSPGHLESYATVFHRVGVVSGRLAASPQRAGLCGAEALLRASFPGGSITGAPKIRAMAIIEGLEGVRRGVFTGAIGWIGFHGDLDLNIAIRTVVVESGGAHFHVGGGIVLDSDPATEYEETLAKGAALAEALGAPLADD